jgi:F-type H+-transporting ATPase subunit a
MFKFILDILIAQVGKRGQSYSIYLVTLFYFILFSNLIGLIPFSFTITSHISLTFMLGASSIIALTIIGFYKQNLHFLELFVPKGVPKALVPLLVVIEVISYIARGFSLAIRLFANLMAGHSLLHILLLFLTKIFKFNYIFGFFGLIIILAIFLLEIGISFLQAYVFIVLISIYLKDSFEVSH